MPSVKILPQSFSEPRRVDITDNCEDLRNREVTLSKDDVSHRNEVVKFSAHSHNLYNTSLSKSNTITLSTLRKLGRFLLPVKRFKVDRGSTSKGNISPPRPELLLAEDGTRSTLLSHPDEPNLTDPHCYLEVSYQRFNPGESTELSLHLSAQPVYESDRFYRFTIRVKIDKIEGASGNSF